VESGELRASGRVASGAGMDGRGRKVNAVSERKKLARATSFRSEVFFFLWIDFFASPSFEPVCVRTCGVVA
jgi:hypothetical protein